MEEKSWQYRFPRPTCDRCPYLSYDEGLKLCNGFQNQVPRQFCHSDPQRVTPSWCPMRTTPIATVYRLKDSYSTLLDHEFRNLQGWATARNINPPSSFYSIQCEVELPQEETIKHFFESAQADGIAVYFAGIEIMQSAVIELSNGLEHYFFYVFDNHKLIPFYDDSPGWTRPAFGDWSILDAIESKCKRCEHGFAANGRDCERNFEGLHKATADGSITLECDEFIHMRRLRLTVNASNSPETNY